MTTADPSLEAELPPPPERPDCCGGGCAICVLDGYFEEVQRWERDIAAIQAARQAQASPASKTEAS